MKKIILTGIIFLVLLVGCSQKQDESLQADVLQNLKKDITLELYIPKKISMGKYEPVEGVYLGAYVKKNSELGGDIKNFEQAIGHKQAFTVFQYSEKDIISNQDILKCIAEKKIPYIKLLISRDYDMSVVYQMIGELNNKYPTPLFIELFPVTQGVKDPVAYKATYEKAYKLIKRYMENAVVIWSIDLERLQEWPIYYPEDYLVDWVGLNVYMPMYKENKKYAPNVITDLDFWYKSFQHKKPMMLSSVAISHFSRIDHTYTVEEAKSKLALIYQTVIKDYPRIKGIIYIDIDMSEAYKDGKDDYRISVQTQLRDYMKATLRNKTFLEEANPSEQDYATQYMKFSVNAIEIENKIYILEDYVTELLGEMPLKKIESIELMEGKCYYSIEGLNEYREFYYNNY